MSGKKARKLRKEQQKKIISKRAVAMCAAVCVGSVSLANGGDFIISVYPQISKPFGTKHNIEYGVGAGAKLTYRPFDFLNLFAYGDYSSLALPGIDPISLVDGGLGFGYHQAITDRMAFDVNFEAGAYNAKSKTSLSGITGGVTLSFTYKFNPVVSADVHASAAHYASGSSPLMTVNAAVSPGLSINLTEIFNNKAKVGIETQELAPVFPVLYGWYENNSFGKVSVTNQEDATITDVTVSFYQPQYMGQPKECGTFTSLGKGESVDVDLYAFFNEQMLELTEKTDTHARVIVSYSCLEQKRTQTFSLVVPVYGRNNMSWDDDRRAAVFVSSKDPAAMLFAKYVTSVVRDNVRNGVPANIQYAMGIFEALDQFGLSYVIDPSSAFEDNVGTSSIDFLQFPYQTLMYRGGDCDDISILVCSLFEAVGIRTAFITIPGHIFMAFDSGLNVHQAQNAFSSLHDFIIDGDEVWVPLEITLSDEGFNKAWRVGAREWNTADMEGAAALYKMHESWEIYQPVSVPGASAFFTMPDRKIVAKLFDHSVDEWISKEIETQVKMYEAKLTVKDDYDTHNKLGVLYGKYGLFIQADEQFKKGRRDGYVPSIINTGNLYFSMSDYERASKWYKSVLKNDPENVLALLGVARCAYELTEYAECDACYQRVKELDSELANEYAYLGTFVSNKGRAFSLADRLQNTIWSQEQEEIPETVKDVLEPENTTQEVLKEEPLSDVDIDDLFDFSSDLLALVPELETEKEEDLEDYDIAGSAGGNDPENPDEFQNEEPDMEDVQTGDEIIARADVQPQLVSELDITYFTEGFTGLVSEVALVDESDFIFEETDDNELPSPENTVSAIAEVVEAATEQTAAAAIISEMTKNVTEATTVLVADTVLENAIENTVALVEAIVDVAKETETVAVTALEEELAMETAVAEEVEAPAVEATRAEVSDVPAVEVAVTEPADVTEETVAPVVEQEVVYEAEAVEEEPVQQKVEIAQLEEAASTEETALPQITEEIAEAPETVAVPAVEEELAMETAVAEEVETPAVEAARPELSDAPAVEVAVTEPTDVVAETVVPMVEQEVAYEAEAVLPLTPAILPAVEVEVPRFTTQPSEEWAPEAAYFAETIPGMRSFDEEMGNFQNSKSFLYEDSLTLEADPDTDTDEQTLKADEEKYANAGVPDVNPFSSYLSEEDAKIMETITNFTLEDIKQPEIQKEESPLIQKTSLSTEIIETVSSGVEVTDKVTEEKIISEPEENNIKTVEAEKISQKEEKTVSADNTETPVEKVEEKIISVKTEDKKEIELSEDIQKEKTVPVRGLLALATAALAGGAGVTVALKKSKKKDEE